MLIPRDVNLTSDQFKSLPLRSSKPEYVTEPSLTIVILFLIIHNPDICLKWLITFTASA